VGVCVRACVRVSGACECVLVRLCVCTRARVRACGLCVHINERVYSNIDKLILYKTNTHLHNTNESTNV